MMTTLAPATRGGWPISGRRGKVSDIVTPIGREEEIR